METTTHNKGNPHDSRNKLVSIHSYHADKTKSYRPSDSSVQKAIDEASLLIGFNWKFDCTWLRKGGFSVNKPVWDVQLAHFMLRNQLVPFPSLDSVLEWYGFPLKLDVVKTQYWDRGIQTDQVPWDILCEYGEGDCERTWWCYLKQKEEFAQKPQMYKLFKLACMDLYTLAEMEWNGLKYNGEKCREKSLVLQEEIASITKTLSAVYADVPVNFGSNDQLSAFLYGGVVKEEGKELVGQFKTGTRAGQPKYRNTIIEHNLPRLFEPIRGSQMSKEGVYSTDESTLRTLRGKHKWIVEKLLHLAKLQKLDSTYYRGLNKVNEEMHWKEGMLYSSYNQCRAVSGRLSSSKPNSQNMSGDILEVFESRYGS